MKKRDDTACWLCSRVSVENALYMWRDGYKLRRENRGVLCPTCAKSLSAWQLPAKKKKETISEPK